jgi:hypothetical protein
MNKIIKRVLVFSTVLLGCENQPWEFPDFDYSTVYFAYQTPVRTIVLGEDYTYDNTLDNEHKCKIMATLGGVYENDNDVVIDVEVDNSLCHNLKFESNAGNDVLPMPSNYYSLPSEMQIVIPAGDLYGGIEVQLTDDFFNDTLSVRNTYVIPLVMKSVVSADSILSGEPKSDTADRRVDGEWSVVPRDYILFAVKFINPWGANYLRRGIDVIDGSTSITYHEQYVEKDQVCSAATLSKNSVVIPLEAEDSDENKTPFEIILNFDANNNCTVQNPEGASYTVTGSGNYVVDGDMWGGEKRNALYLKYDVDFGTSVHSFTDTLVLRDRGVKMELFTPVLTY